MFTYITFFTFFTCGALSDQGKFDLLYDPVEACKAIESSWMFGVSYILYCRRLNSSAVMWETIHKTHNPPPISAVSDTHIEVWRQIAQPTHTHTHTHCPHPQSSIISVTVPSSSGHVC